MVYRQALGAGAVEHSPVEEHTFDMIGPRPIKRMLQGALVDPFGHTVADWKDSRLAFEREIDLFSS